MPPAIILLEILLFSSFSSSLSRSMLSSRSRSSFTSSLGDCPYSSIASSKDKSSKSILS
ncbi:hypothetical protein [Brachyspira hampsonii]|uniref:hypothetical protein n=1 Tax=Brachyspira hampsonii TaxID=1287055 RepID=UPI00210A0A8C|nr:hypothetical protein [Brachyspira hampsonii]